MMREKGPLTIVSGDSNLQIELAKARTIAVEILGPRGFNRPLDANDSAELLIADVMHVSADQICAGLEALPSEYKSQVSELLAVAVNLGRALEGMDIDRKHGRRIEERRRSLDGLRNNNPRSKSAEVRNTARQLDEQLKAKRPKKSQRYLVIAKSLNLNSDQVRYLVEGRRPAKREKLRARK